MEPGGAEVLAHLHSPPPPALTSSTLLYSHLTPPPTHFYLHLYSPPLTLLTELTSLQSPPLFLLFPPLPHSPLLTIHLHLLPPSLLLNSTTSTPLTLSHFHSPITSNYFLTHFYSPSFSSSLTSTHLYIHLYSPSIMPSPPFTSFLNSTHLHLWQSLPLFYLHSPHHHH